MSRYPHYLVCVLTVNLLIAFRSYGGPPFLTDDPEPVPYLNYEAYAFATVDSAADGTTVQAPAFEFNMGVYTNLQFHLAVPLTYSAPADARSSYGLGDIELGAKFRFWNETEYLPELAIFPLLELPSGDADRSLGNGQTWGKIPLWLQKSWGDWTTYGGGGYAINHAPGQRDYAFGGWLLQRKLGDHLSLAGEIFSQDKSAEDGRAYAVINLGGTIQITPNFAILFSGGHSFAGERHAIGYLGLYFTW